MRHNMHCMICLVLMIGLLAGCATQSNRGEQTNVTPPPAVAVAVSAADAKIAFDSPDALTTMLERRWPVSAIQIYCIPERRHNNAYQNLVAFSPRWEGVLHSGVATGFDKIAWYASTMNGRADKYSLGVYRGEDYWLLEGGSEEGVQEPPEYSPDPSKPWFVGHK